MTASDLRSFHRCHISIHLIIKPYNIHTHYHFSPTLLSFYPPTNLTYYKVKMGSTDPYRLGRDVIASTRLNLQHYIWKESIGYLLHPSIRFPDASSNSDISIADVGTGTGSVLPSPYILYIHQRS